MTHANRVLAHQIGCVQRFPYRVPTVGLNYLMRSDPDRVVLTPGCHTLPADSLPPDEYEARIAAHQQRVARDCPSEIEEGWPRCWACGELAPRLTWNQLLGWVARPINLARCGNRAQEMYCPTCFAEWGWPDCDPEELDALDS